LAVVVEPAAVFGEEEAGDDGGDTGGGLETAENGRGGRFFWFEDFSRGVPEEAFAVWLEQDLIVFDKYAVNGRAETGRAGLDIYYLAVIVEAKHVLRIAMNYSKCTNFVANG
jgi:hypothetical protein